MLHLAGTREWLEVALESGEVRINAAVLHSVASYR